MCSNAVLVRFQLIALSNAECSFVDISISVLYVYCMESTVICLCFICLLAECSVLPGY